jgi:hypothetical protein
MVRRGRPQRSGIQLIPSTSRNLPKKSASFVWRSKTRWRKTNPATRFSSLKPEPTTPYHRENRHRTNAKEDDPLSYHIKLEDVKVRNGGEIADYRWSLKGGTVFCREEECDWTFAEYGKQTITAKVTDAAKNSVEITEEFTINRPLQLLRGASNEPLLKVTEEGGANLLVNSFDASLEAYRVEKTIVVPTKLTFDARDVRVKNPRIRTRLGRMGFNGKEQKS